jgi:hypothetical protein
MDLSSIRERLDQSGAGGYETLGDVVSDVELVFKNAMTYNGEKSRIYEDASESLEAFRADMDKTLEQLTTRGVEPLQNKSAEPDTDGKNDSLEAADADAREYLRPEYLPPQVLPGVLQCVLEQWDRKQNWIDSFDETLPLPSGWQVVHEQKTNKVYYWNKASSHTQWEQPKPLLVALPTPLVRATRPPPAATQMHATPSVPQADAQLLLGRAPGEGVQDRASLDAKTGSHVDGNHDGVSGDVDMLDKTEVAATHAPDASRPAKSTQKREPQRKILPSPYLDRLLVLAYLCHTRALVARSRAHTQSLPRIATSVCGLKLLVYAALSGVYAALRGAFSRALARAHSLSPLRPPDPSSTPCMHLQVLLPYFLLLASAQFGRARRRCCSVLRQQMSFMPQHFTAVIFFFFNCLTSAKALK